MAVEIRIDQVEVGFTVVDHLRSNGDELLNAAEEYFIDMGENYKGVNVEGKNYSSRQIHGYRYLPEGWKMGDSNYGITANLKFIVDHLPIQGEIDQVAMELDKLYMNGGV